MTRDKSRKILVALMTLAFAGTGLADRVVLRSTMAIEQDATAQIALGQIADLEGDYAESLAAIVVTQWEPGDAPDKITIRKVRTALEQAEVNLGRVALSGSECRLERRRERVKRPAIAPSESDSADDEAPEWKWAADWMEEATVRGHVGRFVAIDRLARSPHEVQLSFDPTQGSLERAVVDEVVEIVPEGTPNSGRWPLLINVYRHDEVVLSFRTLVDVRTLDRVVIVRRDLPRGHALGHGDLREESRLLPPHPEPAVNRSQDAHGMVTAARLNEGQILRENDLEAPIRVKRNREINFRAMHSGFIVRVRAKALEDGRVGDIIRIQLLMDRSEHLARVDRNGEVVPITTEMEVDTR
ncbi:MAG: flagellar basal body P-ring formation chaperone FlgA [Phycisphaerales bacterium]